MPTKQKNTKKDKEFFDLLDNYLIEDLKTMIFEIKERESGGLGFPAIHSIVSGMELLGIVISGKIGKEAFSSFWVDYLEERFSEYQKDNLKEIFRKFIRNGTAHYFLVKSGVSISKNGKNHLQNINGLLNIDLQILYSHFLKCYRLIKKDVSENKTRLDNFNKGYNELLCQMSESEKGVKEFLNKNSLSDTEIKNPGASGCVFKN